MIEIRYAKEEDAQGIIDVHIKTWRSTYTGLVDQKHLDSMEERSNVNSKKENIKKAMEKGSGELVALDDDKVVGVLTYGPGRAGYEKYGELYGCYILDDYQKQGIGKNLFKIGIKDLVDQGYEGIIYWGLTDNKTLGFHRKLADKVIDTKMYKIGDSELEGTCFYLDPIKFLEKNKK